MGMNWRKWKQFVRRGCILALLAYSIMLGVSAFADNVTKDERSPSIQKPAPGSEGDTLTREDARMALLVYKILDKNGNIQGANLEKGKKLFLQNCRPCHGDDGRRLNFALLTEAPIYMGQRAREDMPTFWHQVNFGDEERSMQAYIDEFTLQELIDIAGFAQTLP